MTVHFLNGSSERRRRWTSNAAAVAPILHTFLTAGSVTETIPSGGFTTATIEVWGGGGGTGAHYNSGGCCPYDVWSSAGGSGGYSRNVIDVTGQSGKTLSITVGGGGAGSAVNYYGSKGSDSSVSSGTLAITTLSAGGGAPGATQTNATIAIVTATASCSGTSLTVTAQSITYSLLQSIEMRGGATTPVLFGSVTKTGTTSTTGTVAINQSQTFASQSITFAYGYGGLGGIASGGSVNTNGNEGAVISTVSPVPSTIGVTGLYAGPYGNGAGNDSATGLTGAVVIRYS